MARSPRSDVFGPKTTDREIQILRRELDALKTQKKGLMQQLLTGQVRVILPKGSA